MKTPKDNLAERLSGLNQQEAETFVALLHRLDRVRLAEVSGYALGLASQPRHTVIPAENSTRDAFLAMKQEQAEDFRQYVKQCGGKPISAIQP